MKKLSILFLFIVLLIIGMKWKSFFPYTSTCERLHLVKGDESNLIMLLDKLAFFVKKPKYLSNFDSVKNSPDLPIRDFYDIKLGINWKALNIESGYANFKLGTGMKVTTINQLLNYADISSDEIRIMTFGLGARTRLIFRLKEGNKMSDYNSWSVNKKLKKFDIKVECDSDSF